MAGDESLGVPVLNYDLLPNDYSSLAAYGSPGAGNWMGGGKRLLADPAFLGPALSTTPTAPAGGWGGFSDFFKGAVGTKEAPGWGGLALGAASGLTNAFLGFKQYGIAKDTLKENKRQFNMNWEAQKNTTNAALADRQRARLSANPGGYQSVDEYMSQYGIQ